MGFNFMKEQNLDIFFEISSKTGDNVISLFYRVADELITKSIQMQNWRQSMVDKKISLNNQKKEKKEGGCC